MNIFRRCEQAVVKRLVAFVARIYLHKPDQIELLQIKITTFRSVFFSLLNELCYIFGLSRSAKLFSLNLEVTNSCNLACQMCPVNHAMVRSKGMMDVALFKKIIDTTPGLEFALVFQWGEPLLHPQFFDMIKYAVQRGIRTMITTNGTLLDDAMIGRLVHSGLERLTFSVDGVGQTHTKIRGFDYDTLKANITRLKEARDRAGSALKIDTSMVIWDATENDVEQYRAEWSVIADRVQVIPRFTRSPRKNKCRELWRGTLVVQWDGQVIACCADYEGALHIGDAHKESLPAIWNGSKMRVLRRAHARRKFDGLICKDCAEYRSKKVSARFS